MSIPELLNIFQKNGYDKENVILITESEHFFHYYTEETCKNMVIPFAVFYKITKKFALFRDIDEDVELSLGKCSDIYLKEV